MILSWKTFCSKYYFLEKSFLQKLDSFPARCDKFSQGHHRITIIQLTSWTRLIALGILEKLLEKVLDKKSALLRMCVVCVHIIQCATKCWQGVKSGPLSSNIIYNPSQTIVLMSAASVLSYIFLLFS